MDDLQILTRTQLVADRAYQVNDVQRVTKILPSYPTLFGDYTDHSDRRSRINCAVRILVVQADVASGDRGAEPKTGFCQLLHRFAKLPKIFRVIWISEVQVVRDRQRFRARADQIPGGFCNRNSSPFARVQFAVKTIAISCRSKILIRFPHIEDSRVRAWRDEYTG